MKRKLLGIMMLLCAPLLFVNKVKAESINVQISGNKSSSLPIVRTTLYYVVGGEFIQVNEPVYITTTDYDGLITGTDKSRFSDPFNVGNACSNNINLDQIKYSLGYDDRQEIEKIEDDFEDFVEKYYGYYYSVKITDSLNETKLRQKYNSMYTYGGGAIHNPASSTTYEQFKREAQQKLTEIQTKYKEAVLPKVKYTSSYMNCQRFKLIDTINNTARPTSFSDPYTIYNAVYGSVDEEYKNLKTFSNILKKIVCNDDSNCNYSDKLGENGQILQNYRLKIEMINLNPMGEAKYLVRSSCDSSSTASSCDGLVRVIDYIIPTYKYEEILASSSGQLTCKNTDKNNEATYTSGTYRVGLSYENYRYSRDSYNQTTSRAGLRISNGNQICNTFCSKKIKFSFPGNVGDSIYRGSYFEWPTQNGTGKYPASITYEQTCEAIGIENTKKMRIVTYSCPGGTHDSAYGCVSDSANELTPKTTCSTGYVYNAATGYCEMLASTDSSSRTFTASCPKNHSINTTDTCYASKKSNFKCSNGSKECKTVTFKNGNTAVACKCVDECGSTVKRTTVGYYYNGGYSVSSCKDRGGTYVNPTYDPTTQKSHPCGNGVTNCCRFKTSRTVTTCKDTEEAPTCKGSKNTIAASGNKGLAPGYYYCQHKSTPGGTEFYCPDGYYDYYNAAGNLRCVLSSYTSAANVIFNGDEYVFITNPTCPSGYVDAGYNCIKTYSKLSNTSYRCPAGYTANASGTCDLNCDMNHINVTVNKYDNLRIKGGTNQLINNEELVPSEIASQPVVTKNKKSVTTTVNYSLKQSTNRYFNRITFVASSTPQTGLNIYDRKKGVISTKIDDPIIDVNDLKRYPLTLSLTKNGGTTYCNPSGTFEEKIACNISSNTNQYTCNYTLNAYRLYYCKKYENGKLIHVTEKKHQECLKTKTEEQCKVYLCTDTSENFCTGVCDSQTKSVDGVYYNLKKCNGKICSFELFCKDSSQFASASSQEFVYKKLGALNESTGLIDYSKIGDINSIENAIRTVNTTTPICLSTSKVIFRTIDLEKPFTNSSGGERTPGYNWNSQELKETKITKARGVEGQKLYQQKPIITIKLTPNDIKNIKTYNNQQQLKYSNFDLTCDNDTSACSTSFFKKENINNIEIKYNNSNCDLRTSLSEEKYNKCFNSNK